MGNNDNSTDKNQTFEVEITEVLQRRITVVSTSKEEAIRKVTEMYSSESIVLDSADLVDSKIEIPEELESINF